MLYLFRCDAHGPFEQLRRMAAAGLPAYCPECGESAQRVFTAPAIKVVTPQRLRYGSGSPGKTILGKDTGGLDIFIPSDGCLEQAEVDYIAEGAIEKEQVRVKKRGFQRENQARVAAYSELALNTKPGQRAKTLRRAIVESGDRIRT